jgi:hypothetical protein
VDHRVEGCQVRPQQHHALNLGNDAAEVCWDGLGVLQRIELTDQYEGLRLGDALAGSD